jgi:heme-degrading monooxygenase HmoA
MLVIIWEYQVKAGRVAEFEHIYSANGAWAELFRRAEGFQDTKLLRDSNDPYHYLTMDCWESVKHYELFLSHWKTEYTALDAQCAGLTEKEFLSGKWESISSETR